MANTLKSHGPKELLRRRILESGPVTFRDWMETALYAPASGYYMQPKRVRWGRWGDYRTSPDRTSLFAATFARYFARLHQSLGAPKVWTIVEAGAGPGLFASGVLTTLQKRFSETFAATHYVIDELSSDSLAHARSLLAKFDDRVSYRSLAELEPVNSGIIFSNELFDAFPVHRVLMAASEIRELYVGIGKSGEFIWSTGPASTPKLARYLEHSEIQLRDGQTAEINLEIEPWLRRVAERLPEGYLITVDYGAEASELYGAERMDGTLRAFNKHNLLENVLDNCGEQDITSTVDWSLVKRIGAELDLRTIDFQRQDQFLLAAGLLDELDERRKAAGSEAERAILSAEAREMILPSGMSASFQVLVQEKSVKRQSSPA